MSSRDVAPAEREATLALLDDLTIASQRAWLDGRTDYEDWREYVAAVARRLGVRLWPSLLRELREAAPNTPEWLRQEAAEILASHIRVRRDG
jgi:hypothetical protein